MKALKDLNVDESGSRVVAADFVGTEADPRDDGIDDVSKEGFDRRIVRRVLIEKPNVERETWTQVAKNASHVGR